MDKIEIQANYELIQFDDREIKTVGTHNGEVTNMLGKYTGVVNIFTVGLSYDFLK